MQLIENKVGHESETKPVFLINSLSKGLQLSSSEIT